MVRLQSVERVVETARQLGQLCLLFIGQGVEIHIIWSPAVFLRVDFVFDAVQSRHQDGGVAQIRIAGGIRVTDFEAAQLRRLGISRNADDGAAI